MPRKKPQKNHIGRLEFERKLKEKVSEEKIRLVMRAYRFSKYGHMIDIRDSGVRYFEHPKRVALILMDELGIYDHEMIIAALLHDIKEDSFILEWEDIEDIFDEKVLVMVKILTKEKSKGGKVYIRKIRKAEEAARIIKLADRLDNLRELWDCSTEKQERTIRETEKYYLSIAKRTNGYLYKKMKEICDSYKNRVI